MIYIYIYYTSRDLIKLLKINKTQKTLYECGKIHKQKKRLEIIIKYILILLARPDKLSPIGIIPSTRFALHICTAA